MVTHSFDLLDIFCAYTQSLDALWLLFHAHCYQFKTKKKILQELNFN